MRGSCLTGPIVWLLSSFNTHLDLEVPLAGVQTPPHPPTCHCVQTGGGRASIGLHFKGISCVTQ